MTKLFLALCFFTSSQVLSEPWLGTRFAQNCGACHAPSRINLKSQDRRCTLSCQGCHVNPSGGGLRSFYGKWNSNRWLKSFQSSKLHHDLNPAPLDEQIYGQTPYRRRKTSKRKILSKGVPLIESTRKFAEEAFARKKHRYGKIASHKSHYLYQVPQGDPWRQMTLGKIDGGGDFRYFASSTSINDSEKGNSDHWVNFLMNADLALRYRPFYRSLHLVYESRIYGNPTPQTQRFQYLAGSSTRSLYALVDNLPYNTYVMAGYYRPLFGQYTANHRALGQRLQSFLISNSSSGSHSLSFDAISVGAAPNVPFINIHRINRRIGSAEKMEGFITNIGLRFVTMGLALNHSYWGTTEGQTQLALHSISAMATWKKLILGWETLILERGDPGDTRNSQVHTLEAKWRLWREIYLDSSFATANTSLQATAGSAGQTSLGVRGFLYPGTEVALYLDQSTHNVTETSITTATTGWSLQFHGYF
ncbi:MAG: hypothetical protein AB8C84_10995 [Oligoflexales bacterium]